MAKIGYLSNSFGILYLKVLIEAADVDLPGYLAIVGYQDRGVCQEEQVRDLFLPSYLGPSAYVGDSQIRVH